MGSRPEITVHPDAAALAQAAAVRFAALAARAERVPFTVALAGGSTPRALYERLATPPLAPRIPWDRLELFFGDERAVGPDHTDSNYRMAREALLAHVPVTAHPMAAERGDAEAYAALLATRVPARRDGQPALDLILLGMGEDGHTASLFPGTAALAETARPVVMNDVPQLGTRRMTVTFPVINAADRVWILVTGASKSALVAHALAGGQAATDLPVQRVRPSAGELVWWLDAAAAGELGA